MCHLCPEIPPAQKASVLEKSTKHLKFLERALNEYLRHQLDLEDQYREAGIHYHCTDSIAREDAAVSEHHQKRFQDLFEITHVEEYNMIFEPLFNIVAALNDLRDKYVRYHGTAEELFHRVNIESVPAYESLILDQLVPFCEELNDVFRAVTELYDLSRTFYETDRAGHRHTWHDSTRIDQVLQPRIMREECEKYHAWVGSLPETRRALQGGRPVDEAALDLLYSVPEGFEPETY
jgi:hypothetical protein